MGWITFTCILSASIQLNPLPVSSLHVILSICPPGCFLPVILSQHLICHARTDRQREVSARGTAQQKAHLLSLPQIFQCCCLFYNGFDETLIFLILFQPNLCCQFLKRGEFLCPPDRACLPCAVVNYHIIPFDYK
jgi:hypothetical protein